MVLAEFVETPTSVTAQKALPAFQPLTEPQPELSVYGTLHDEPGLAAPSLDDSVRLSPGFFQKLPRDGKDSALRYREVIQPRLRRS
jgi:hypothetical protein